jgi:hypothetical protein
MVYLKPLLLMEIGFDSPRTYSFYYPLKGVEPLLSAITLSGSPRFLLTSQTNVLIMCLKQ